MAKNKYPLSNLHVHTPHSFSYFSSIAELVDRASQENIKVLGINDFNTVEGFEEFTLLCGKKNIIPSYGIEVMALNARDQEDGVLVNDPGNPGRVYLCGKGIPYPPPGDQFAYALLGRIKAESRERMADTVKKLNEFFLELDLPLSMSFEEIERETPSGWVRERHIAKALAEKITESGSPGALVKKLTGEGEESITDDFPLLQNLLRSKLLKAGRRAYVRESEGAFAGMDEAKKLFLALGAIPVYPVLADGAGKFTHREKDPEALAEWLNCLGYHAVEFIPHRNTVDVLTRYAETLSRKGFIVTAGSEHNSPGPLPLKSIAKDSGELPLNLEKIFWEGCCAVAAHQAQKSKKLPGFVGRNGERTNIPAEELIEQGETIIQRSGKDG